ncbi:hypothetical protein DL766_006047 [Monosporascus sp. MC13-8B]|uniref:Uncharacterized protein n=1 Tax=Monosporascus cannonballus TaxID=155416 RepID=A0ABY0GZ97_9PEZI|nr:hypothetical protein DL762_008526 [Monosporascus cannonballus]RYP28151.1 hypothetical protein DL766_006047 [Monosporascus sp. MC13-8B]
MAWGRPTNVEDKTASTTARQLLPLIIALVILAGLAFVGYQVYLSVTQIRRNAKQRMASRHNVVFTRGGVRVGVKHVEQEAYVDRTQSWVVKAWNMGESKTDPNTVKRR